MNLLQKKLIEASQKYYTDGTSDMTDQEFDAALEELKKEDPNNPIITQVGHGYDVNQDTTGQKIKHRYFAGSLTKCHNWQEYPKEFKVTNSSNVGLSVKLDGLSVVLYYESGELVQALSRGDGDIGIDITAKIKKIEPSYISIADKTFTGAVRGEILMLKSQFERYKEIHPDASNPRNTATGLINGKYIEDSDLLYLNVILYTVIGAHSCKWASSYTLMMSWLESQFSGHVVPWAIACVSCTDFEEQMQTFIDRGQQYPYDGVVITKLDTNYSGDEVKYNAVAFKFAAESTTAEVLDVEWSLSKTKYLVPRIKINPVRLSGATIQYATGFNAKFISDNGIGPGAKVKIMRSGEVIPYIYEMVESVQPHLPTKCPFCERELEWRGVHLACPNSGCGDAVIQDLLVWVKNIAPTMGLGDKLILDFFFQDFSEPSITAVYRRGQVQKETSSIQYQTFLKMYDALFTNKVELDAALRALNIPRLGEVTSRKLAQNADMVKMLCKHAHEGTDLNTSEIITLGQYIGQANTGEILSNLQKFDNLTFIYNNIIWSDNASSDVRKVAITGKLSMKRSEFECLLKQFGFVASDTISSDTFALITDDPNSSSSKNVKASKLNIPKLSEQEFRSKYLGN